VFGRGGEEALALVDAGIAFEVVPGVSSAIAAAELASIPVTHRGVASAFLVMAGHTTEMVERTLRSVQPNGVSLIVMMGLGVRGELSTSLVAHGWAPTTPAAIVCAASTVDEWVWSGRLAELGGAQVPESLAGVLVIGDVVGVRASLLRHAAPVDGVRTTDADAVDEVMYGRH
jgi:siroheme synthase